MAESDTLILGNNEVTNCAAALRLDGEEVFRIRENAETGEFLIDCDLRNQQSQRIAKIARNAVPYVADGYQARVGPRQPTEVIHEASGQVVGRIQRLAPRRIKVTGCFCVNGYWTLATEEAVFLPGDVVIANNLQGLGHRHQAGPRSARPRVRLEIAAVGRAYGRARGGA
jgi:hypothetical protein